MTLAGLHRHYRSGDFSPRELLEALLCECEPDRGTVWITLLDSEQLQPYLERLEGLGPDDLPLYGIPFAIKDNIDLAGVPTTAACPAFEYVPAESAYVVSQLIDAGAIPLGKTNMDQFATGLVGTRSPPPWGPCPNALNADYISGGSSSGSAVAVSKAQVCFSLGTDTAGSGRVPAAFNNIVGLKPSRGVLSTRGVVPACRSLDVVSIFALTARDANRIFDCAASEDRKDPYARANPFHNGPRYFAPTRKPLKIGVLAPEQRNFFDDSNARDCFNDALEQIKGAGHELIEVDLSPCLEAAHLLYEGPWLAERYLAVRQLIEHSPQDLHPVILKVIGDGDRQRATDTFQAMYTLNALCQRASDVLDTVDMVVTPTVATCYRTQAVLDDPLTLNANLGVYTNFMNLMDYSAVALPTGFFPSGVGFGITLFHRAFSDKRLLGAAAALQDVFALRLGATAQQVPVDQPSESRAASTHIDVVVCGAHLSGQPLNWQLLERGAHLVQRTTSTPGYRLYALADGKRPALVRDTNTGREIAVEVWSVPSEAFGSFVAEIPAPLGIGKVELADGRWCTGFICENYGLEGARDISSFGGWLAYLTA
ncbi:MAG: allophanate hydrolase [Halioglobus sp.]